MLCFFADPKIYIFPRTRATLCKENPDTKNLEFVTMIDTFKDSNLECPIQKKKFKEIETRIYADFAKEISNDTVKVSRYFSTGYLKKQGDNYSYFPKNHRHNHYLEVIAKCSDSNLACTVSWCNDRGQIISNDNDNTVPICILPTGYKDCYSLQNILLTVLFPKDLKINNQEIIIEVKEKSSSKKAETYSFYLYKNNQANIAQFNYQKKPIEDFFVIPTQLSPSDNQKNIIKELQKLNNQVLARNKKMDNNFTFLAETGILDENKKLIENIKNSIKAFKSNSENLDEGCRSGNSVHIEKKDKNGGITQGIIVNYPYNFDNFGQDESLLNYISSIYKLSKNDVQGLIIDKNYLYGNYIKGDLEKKIEGVCNLYEYVVIPFTEAILTNAESYLNFNKRWLTCPKYNPNYKRGNFKVPSGQTKELHLNNGQIEILNSGSVIKFKAGADIYAFDEDESHEYEITAVGNQKKQGFILLNYTEKQQCDDRLDENYSDYACINSSITDSEDSSAITLVSQTNGIPYYMNDMDADNNAGCAKLKNKSILNWNENAKNWYSYTNKPNTGKFGIDCSGLVSNSISSFVYKNKEAHFSNIGSCFQNCINANRIKTILSRQIPKIENGDYYLFENSDCLVSSVPHIVLIDTDNNQVSINDYNTRRVKVIHSYFGYNNNQSTITTLSNNQQYVKGNWNRTLKGPYRHANLLLSNTTVGRFYLWY